jgi:uncharacterized protein
MVGRLPEYLDIRKVFLQQKEISGVIDLVNLTRLQGILSDNIGKTQIDLVFSLNDSKQRLIRGSIRARLNVLCQRCLESLEISIEDEFSLVVVDSEESAAKLDDSLDPWVCVDHKLGLAGLVEEQLILCVPIVNYHQDPKCVESLGYDPESSEELIDEKVQNPFAVLQKLKT